MTGAVRVGLVGLGYWGPNLARNFEELADLRWLCDVSAERRASSERAELGNLGGSCEGAHEKEYCCKGQTHKLSF